MDTENELPPEVETHSRKGKTNWASLRDIGNLLKSQWPKYLIDVLVIILGITISFTLDNRKEEAGKNALEHVYLQSLLGDIESDIDEINKVIHKTETVIANAGALLATTDKKEIRPDSIRGFVGNVRLIMERPNFISKDATFSDLKSSGNMQLIHDIKLKSGLFEYYRFYEGIQAIETAERETTNTIIAPYVVSRFSIRRMSGMDRGDLSVAHLNQIINETEFGNVVSLRFLKRRELLGVYQEELKLAEQIKHKLELLLL